MASYVYMLYSQIAIVYSDWTNDQDYTLLIAFLVKESFFVTYLVVWLALKVVVPVAMLPLIVLIKILSSGKSNYQQQKVRLSIALQRQFPPVSCAVFVLCKVIF